MRVKRRDRQIRMGRLPPRYSFALNPHAAARFTKCPRCDARTKLRKLPLVVHVGGRDGGKLVVLGKSCRLCTACELLIAHDAEISNLLTHLAVGPERDADGYLVLGTLERPVWHRGLGGGVAFDELLEHMADFKEHIRVDFEPGGWRPRSTG